MDSKCRLRSSCHFINYSFSFVHIFRYSLSTVARSRSARAARTLNPSQLPFTLDSWYRCLFLMSNSPRQLGHSSGAQLHWRSVHTLVIFCLGCNSQEISGLTKNEFSNIYNNKFSGVSERVASLARLEKQYADRDCRINPAFPEARLFAIYEIGIDRSIIAMLILNAKVAYRSISNTDVISCSVPSKL